MRSLQAFDQYLNEGIAKKVSVDISRASSLILQSEKKYRSLSEMKEKIGVSDDNANDFVEHCYDAIMLRVRARMYRNGYCASGQGAHEAEVAYLVKLGFPENEVLFLDKMRYFRNGILYYGTSLDVEYAQKVLVFTKRIYPKLKLLIG